MYRKIIDIANSLEFINDFNTNGITGNNARITTSQYGELFLYSTQPSINSSTATVVLYNGGLSINNTTDTISLTSGGSLTVRGGASFEKSIRVGDSAYMTNTISINTSTTNLTTGNLTVSNDGANYMGNSTGSAQLTLQGASGANFSIYAHSDGRTYLQYYNDFVINRWGDQLEEAKIYISALSGNVGISTTDPSHSLDVNGGIRANNISAGNIYFTGNLYQNDELFIGGGSSQWADDVDGSISYTSGAVNIANGIITNLTIGNYLISNINTNDLNLGISNIYSGSFTLSNNNTTPLNITGLLFNNIRSFTINISISIERTGGNLYETFVLDAIKTDSQWMLYTSSYGDDSGIVFSITNDGYIQYISSNISGFINSTARFYVNQIANVGNYIHTTPPTQGTILIDNIQILNTTDSEIGINSGSLYLAGGATISKSLYALNIGTTTLTTATLNANHISVGSLSATTITGANLSLSENLIIGGTLTTVNITTSNMTDTNISTGTLNISTGLTTVSILATGLTSASILATNISSSTLALSTGLTTVSILTTGLTSANILTTELKTNILNVISGSVGNNSLGFIGGLGGGGNKYTLHMGAYTNGTIGTASLSFTDDNSFSSSINFSTKVPGSESNNQVERMRISSNGFVGIGTAFPSYTLDVSGGVRVLKNTAGWNPGLLIRTPAAGNENFIMFNNNPNVPALSTGTWLLGSPAGVTGGTFILAYAQTPTNVITAYTNGNVTIGGSLSKGSGTFDIEHPLDQNKRLCHSFIEGPRCDLIYRGSVSLVNGTANVNIDTESTANTSGSMSQGTFEALCANPIYYLQNDESFDRVRGSITGNVLTITCENTSSTDKIHWIVVAERKDNFIKAWDRTDSNGFLIPEYFK